MPAKELGLKHVCWKCGTKFYDMKKPVPACPKCGADAREAPVVRAPAAEKRAKAAAKPPVVDEVPELPEEPEVDEDVDEVSEDEPEERTDDEG